MTIGYVEVDLIANCEMIEYKKDKYEGKWLFYACIFVHLVLEKPLEGLHIVVDAGNGAGGFFVVMCLLLLVL